MPRVLLIRPLCEGDEPEFAEPLGLERLAGYLRSQGVEDVRIADRRLYEEERRQGVGSSSFWQVVRSEFAHGDPTHVGLSLMTSADLSDALRLISRLRAYYPRASFCAGGVFVSTSAEEARRRLPQDVHLILNEGENELLAWVRGDEARNVVLSPDDWAPAFRPDLARYAALGCAVNMQTSRGCPGVCAFCATPSLPAPYRTWRARDLGLIVNEIACESARLQSAGLLPIFNFVDDDFGPLSRVEALARELGKSGLRISFALEMRMASLIGQHGLTDRLRSLHDAGLTRVFVGIESLDPETLRLWKKPYDTSKLPHVVRAFDRAGIVLQPGYILWHNGQTIDGAKDELEGLWELGIYSHRAAISRLIAFSGCALGPDAAELGNAERFYTEFATRTAGLTHRWVEAAVKEPYAAAVAYLTGDDAYLRAIRASLANVNEQSFGLFMNQAQRWGRQARS